MTRARSRCPPSLHSHERVVTKSLTTDLAYTAQVSDASACWWAATRAVSPWAGLPWPSPPPEWRRCRRRGLRGARRRRLRGCGRWRGTRRRSIADRGRRRPATRSGRRRRSRLRSALGLGRHRRRCRSGLSPASPAPPGTGAFASTAVGETATTAGARVGGGAIRARIASTSAFAACPWCRQASPCATARSCSGR